MLWGRSFGQYINRVPPMFTRSSTMLKLVQYIKSLRKLKTYLSNFNDFLEIFIDINILTIFSVERSRPISIIKIPGCDVNRHGKGETIICIKSCEF